MVYNVWRINEARMIGTTIQNAKDLGERLCYFDIEFDENIQTLRELGFFVAYAPEQGTYCISWS